MQGCGGLKVSLNGFRYEAVHRVVVASAAQRKRIGSGLTPARRSIGISARVAQSLPLWPHQMRCTAISLPTAFSWKTLPVFTSTPKLNDRLAPGLTSPRSAENQCAMEAEHTNAVLPLFSTVISSDWWLTAADAAFKPRIAVARKVR